MKKKNPQTIIFVCSAIAAVSGAITSVAKVIESFVVKAAPMAMETHHAHEPMRVMIARLPSRVHVFQNFFSANWTYMLFALGIIVMLIIIFKRKKAN